MKFFNTRRARNFGSVSFAGAANSAGCWVQHEPISTTERGAKRKGGAFKLDKSPRVAERYLSCRC